MNTLKKAAHFFLKSKSIAVVGVSSKGDTAANIIYRKLRKMEYNVFAVNPNAETVEGDSCYPDIASVPDKIEAVMIGTHPDVTPIIIDECIELNIKYVWIHKSIGQGSLNMEAVNRAINAGVPVIPGSCPMMFLDPVDPAHTCMKWFFKFSGQEVKPIGF